MLDGGVTFVVKVTSRGWPDGVTGGFWLESDPPENLTWPQEENTPEHSKKIVIHFTIAAPDSAFRYPI